jgi:N-formylglutamate amidohydrolase
MVDAFVLVAGDGPIVATAVHHGHALRPEIQARIALDDATRLREEDPFTGRLAAVAPTSLVATRSRFEVDLNRPRDNAVYRTRNEAWGLSVWREPCDDAVVARSLAVYDAFYATLERVLGERARRHGRLVVLDVHSYNHRRGGPDAPPADPASNPEINVGTGSLDRRRWGGIVDRFMADLAACSVRGHRLDVRENVKFRGAALAAWVRERFAGVGCAIAIEHKKTFMDEWTGRLDEAHLGELCGALASTLGGLEESLGA